jgi:predicted dienelactone hydrolase
MRWCSLLLVVVGAVDALAAPFAVGVSDVTFVDADRGGRSVPTDLHYPAATAGVDVPVAGADGERFPVVVIGHGYQIPADRYGWIAARLAESGFVVATPRTAGELFPSHEQFGLDLAFVVRALREADDDPQSPFAGRIAPTAAVAGHSMGGGASFLAAASDPSITAVVNFAAAETDPSAIAACGQLVRPVLMFAATDDCVTPPADHQIPMFQALLEGDRTLVSIDGASHCQFAESSFLCELGEFCSPSISRTEQHDLTWFLLEPWLRGMLRDEHDQRALFQNRLEEQAGISFLQEGIPVDAPAAPVGGPRLHVTPNPFNPVTEIRFVLPKAMTVQLDVFAVDGRRVRRLVSGDRVAGPHTVRWDGRDEAGSSLASGTYRIRLRADGQVRSRAVTLLK